MSRSRRTPRPRNPEGPPAAGGDRRRRRRAAAAATALAAAAAAIAAWIILAPVRSYGGVDLGRLPAGLSPDDLNVLLVTLDTTRADRLGPYGYQGAQTPTLDRLAREGVVFDQAASAAPLTQPSHATMFTSRLPPAHGVRDNGVAALAGEELTLAEALRDTGRRTAAFVGAYVLDSRWGFDQGFDLYVDDFDLSQYRAISLGGIERRASEVADAALRWLEGAGDEPFFAWLHFFDAHAPYSPPEPFRSAYAGRGYAGEIAYMDAQLGRVVQVLESRGLLDRTIVVVVGDHGESLGEHGEGAHGFFLYEGVIRVPLIVRTPYPAARGRVARLVHTVDLMPTILDLLGRPAPESATGRSLAAAMTGAGAPDQAEAYAESQYPLNQFGWSDLKSLRSGRYKFIDAPRPELYDLERDPGEEHNLYEERRGLADAMRERLREIHRAAAERAPRERPAIEMDPDTRARLAALGYVGTFTGAVSRPDEEGGLADPKDRIDLFNRINRASELSKHEGRADEAIAILERVVADDPTVIAAWFMLGNEYVRQGRFEQGIAQYRRALALKPDYDLAVTNLANTYRRMGRDEDAAAGYERLLQASPRNTQARFQLAQIRAEQDRLAEAEALINEALAIEPELAGAHNVLGIIRFRQGDAAGGAAAVRAALARNPEFRGARFNLALMAEERGDLAGAIRDYQAEIERHPDHYKALFNLGRLYGQVGDRPRQLDAFRRAIEANPHFAEGHLFLAKLYLDLEDNLDEAIRLARRGIELGDTSEFAPLGHYVIADIYARRGMAAEARREAARGRQREAALAARAGGRKGTS